MWRKRRYFLVLIVDFFALSILFLLLKYLIAHHLYFSTKHNVKSYMDHHQFSFSLSVRKSKSIPRSVKVDVTADNQPCTMESCFDFSHCREGFKAYVYPNEQNFQRSPLFEEMLSIIRSSPYLTSDPEEACLFIPSIDTLDRDKHSDDFVKNLPSLSSLPYWNGGRNHLLFVQYSGTYPDYSEHLDFPTGLALLARASFSSHLYRTGFDVSLPLMHKEHPQLVVHHSGVLSHESMPGFLPVKRKYLLVFKGKRYLYGRGSRIRSSLYHLHNHGDVVMLTTCKHNQDWLKYTDDRCEMDNALYDRWVH